MLGEGSHTKKTRITGRRRRRRQRTSWVKAEAWTGLTPEEAVRVADDQVKWRRVVRSWCIQPSDRGWFKKEQTNPLHVPLPNNQCVLNKINVMNTTNYKHSHTYFCRAILCIGATDAFVRCLSVRPSVTFVYSVQINKRIFKIFSP